MELQNKSTYENYYFETTTFLKRKMSGLIEKNILCGRCNVPENGEAISFFFFKGITEGQKEIAESREVDLWRGTIARNS